MRIPNWAMILALAFLLSASANLADADILDGLISAWSFDGNLRDSVSGNDGVFFDGGAKPPDKDKPKDDSGPVGPAKGIVAGWDFDGDLEDGIGDNDGEFWGAPAKNKPVYVKGRFGRAIEFDGIDDYIEIPDDESFHLPYGLTVAAWININVGGDHAAICWKGEQIGWGANFSWRVCTTSDTGMTWGRCRAGSEDYFATSDVLPGTGQWVHVAMTCMSPDAPTNQRAYVNGEDITNVTDQPGNLTAKPPFLIFEDVPVLIGVGLSVGGEVGNDTYFNGLIDDLGIWDRGLTVEEIEEVMDRGLSSRFSVDARGKMATTWGRLKK